MKVLITGGAGFIGSHLVNKFLEEGHEVIVIDNLSTGSINNIKDYMCNNNFMFINGDIKDQNLMEDTIMLSDIIFHFAAIVGMKRALSSSIWDMIENNIKGTEFIIKMANKYKKRIFIASTSEIYGKIKGAFKEDGDILIGSPVKKRWNYAYSKIMDELCAFSYMEKFNLPVTILRFFNVIGHGQSDLYGMVVPTFIKSALNNDAIPICGSGFQKRSFIYIKDVINYIYKLFEIDYIGVINIGSKENISIINLAAKIINLTHSNSNIKFYTYEEIYGKDFEDIMDRVPDLTLLNSLVNYNPISIDQSINEIIKYEKENNIYLS